MTYDRIYIGAEVSRSMEDYFYTLLSPGGIMIGPFGHELVKIVKKRRVVDMKGDKRSGESEGESGEEQGEGEGEGEEEEDSEYVYVREQIAAVSFSPLLVPKPFPGLSTLL
jgi:protein-L-isoaspartate O-methyltransferase